MDEEDDEIECYIEKLNQQHLSMIKAYEALIRKKIIVVFLPFTIGMIIYLTCQFYLLPNGLIQEYHVDYERYQPITMTEVWLVFYMSQFISVFIAIRYLQNYLWNIRTIPIHDGDRTSDAIAIGSIDTPLGGRLYFGRNLGDKYLTEPTEYMNREGITFSNLDQAELLNVVKYIYKQDHLNDKAFKGGTAKYQKLSVSMKGEEKDA